jgi:iron complex outermembrane receptor protein
MTRKGYVLAQAILFVAAGASGWLGFTGLAPAAESGATGLQRGPAAEDDAAAGEQLEEVLVTATHFSTEANKTPLSLSTVTVDQLNQQGINRFSDLVGMVPSLQISGSTQPSLATINIRGIIQSSGAATTGFYLDNTPLPAYANPSVNAGSGNGTPLPPIFDLQRVEVLEGPQGTLFGASSMGGTIRYITPAPSLQSWQAYVKLDGSKTDYADGLSYSPGVAVGGPIIQDVLGFRASAIKSHRAGWIQMMDPNSQKIVGTSLNTSESEQFNGTLLWRATEQLSARASFFASKETSPYIGTAYNYSQPYQIVAPELGFNNTGVTPATPRSSPTPVCVGAACATYTGVVTYRRPAAVTGPYVLEPFTVMGQRVQADAPASLAIDIKSLDLTWEHPRFIAQLLSSYVRTVGRQSNPNTTATTGQIYNVTIGPEVVPRGMTFSPGAPDMGIQIVRSRNERRLWSEDLRFSSIQGPAEMGKGLFSWTAGLYYKDERHDIEYQSTFPTGGIDAFSRYLFGLTTAQRYGIGPNPYDGGLGADVAPLQTETITGFREDLRSTDAAVYAEGNYNITANLQATLGVRGSRPGFEYVQERFGPTNLVAVATFANGLKSSGSSHDNVFTPKAQLTYRFSNTKLVYAVANKGFRGGGANFALGDSCAPGLATYGLKITDIPLPFGPDSVWNYELGTKLGMAGGRVQVNAAAYRLEWSDVQTTVSPVGCGSGFTTNAGKAISEGFELSGQAIALKGLLLNAAFGYNDAYYSEDAIGVKGAPGFPDLITALKGQKFALAPWTSAVGARLDLATAFGIGVAVHPYVRADWTLRGGYTASKFGLTGYNPNTAEVPQIPLLNLRAGVDVGAVNLNVYALNVTDSRAGTETGGRTGCTTAACTTYTNNTPFLGRSPANAPRTIGLQFTYVQR